jgi:ketosteroid isomerase-like protein
MADSFAMGPPTTIALQECDGVFVGDNTLVALCTWQDTITMPDGSRQVVPLHSSEVLVKQKDGRFLLRMDHASFVPPPQAPAKR